MSIIIVFIICVFFLVSVPSIHWQYFLLKEAERKDAEESIEFHQFYQQTQNPKNMTKGTSKPVPSSLEDKKPITKTEPINVCELDKKEKSADGSLRPWRLLFRRRAEEEVYNFEYYSVFIPLMPVVIEEEKQSISQEKSDSLDVFESSPTLNSLQIPILLSEEIEESFEFNIPLSVPSVESEDDTQPEEPIQQNSSPLLSSSQSLRPSSSESLDSLHLEDLFEKIESSSTVSLSPSSSSEGEDSFDIDALKTVHSQMQSSPFVSSSVIEDSDQESSSPFKRIYHSLHRLSSAQSGPVHSEIVEVNESFLLSTPKRRPSSHIEEVYQDEEAVSSMDSIPLSPRRVESLSFDEIGPPSASSSFASIRKSSSEDEIP